jgi:hypothetical protein
MTHIAPMPDSAGSFSEFKDTDGTECRACKAPNVGCRTWESSCGGYEDYQYRCFTCGHSWWVDGIDS